MEHANDSLQVLLPISSNHQSCNAVLREQLTHDKPPDQQNLSLELTNNKLQALLPVSSNHVNGG
eukprot:1136807-Pelagomonas_calceolata.AAC.1